jgi:cytoskeletal protein CcmA (bactofilin family)
MAKEKRPNIDTIVGPHGYFEGILSSRQSLRIDGMVKGRIECKDTVIIGHEGKVEGDIDADNIFIAGELTGNAKARDCLEISKSGRMFGDISTAKLVVAEGVVFDGSCHMLCDEEMVDKPELHDPPAPIQLLK